MDESVIKQLLAQVKDNPLIAMILQPIVGTMFAGSGSLLNPATYDQSKSLNANVQRSMDAQTYSNTFGSLAALQTRANTNDLLSGILQRSFGYSPDAAANALNGSGWGAISSVVNMAIGSGTAGNALNSVYTAAFNRRYLANGVGANGVDNLDRYANDYRGVGERMLAEHYVNRSYGSMSLEDTSALYSSLIGTGKYDNIGKGNAKQKADAIAKDAKEYSKALSTLKDTLGGSVAEIIQSVEALYQTGLGSISPQQLSNMANNLTHAVSVTGVNQNKLAHMSAVAYQYIAPYGGDAMLSAQIANSSAYNMTSDPRVYGLSRDRYEANVVALHTNRALNGDVRYMSAAYQAWADKNKVNAQEASSYEQFLADVKKSGVTMNSAGMSDFMKQLGISDAQASSLLSSSMTSRLGAQFDMTGAMLDQRVDRVNARRQSLLRRIAGAAVANEIGDISDKTGDDIYNAVMNSKALSHMSIGDRRVIAQESMDAHIEAARAGLGMSDDKAADEFMRQGAAAKRARTAQLWRTGVLSAFRDDRAVTAGGLEGMMQLFMGGKGDLSLSSVLSVGMFGVDFNELAKGQGTMSKADIEKAVSGKVTDQYKKVFGDDAYGALEKAIRGENPNISAADLQSEMQQRMRTQLRGSLMAEYEASGTLLAKGVTYDKKGNPRAAQKEYQVAQAKALNALQVLRRNKDDKEAREALEQYVKDERFEHSDLLKYAVKTRGYDKLFTEDGRKELQQGIRQEQILEDIVGKDKLNDAKKSDAVKKSANKAIGVLKGLDANTTDKLVKLYKSGKQLSEEELQAAGLNKQQAADVMGAAKDITAATKADDTAAQVMQQLMTAAGKGPQGGIEGFFQVIIDILRQITDLIPKGKQE